MRVNSLHIYPVKSAGAVNMPLSADTGVFGFKGDRQFMVVSAERGKMITQRENAKLATIGVRRRRGGSAKIVAQHEDDEVYIDGEHADQRVTVKHHRSVEMQGFDCGDAAAEFFSAVLGQDARLVFHGFDFNRPVDPAFDPGLHTTGYADGFQYLITTMASLNALNNGMRELGLLEMSMDRFRPNIVIEGDFPAFDEDYWERVEIDGVQFDLTKPCSRCVIPSIDQQSGENDRKATVGLKHVGRQGRIEANNEIGVMFGMNSLCGSVDRPVRVGGAVKVLSRRAEPLWSPLKPKG